MLKISTIKIRLFNKEGNLLCFYCQEMIAKFFHFLLYILSYYNICSIYIIFFIKFYNIFKYHASKLEYLGNSQVKASVLGNSSRQRKKGENLEKF